MLSPKTFTQLALAFEEATEQPHFEKTSFRVNKKIFATLDTINHSAVLKLSEVQQSVFCLFDAAIIYPANGAWGKQGWTIFNLKKVTKPMLHDALTQAYCNVAPLRLSINYK